MTKTRPWAELAAKIEADPVRRARMAEYGRVFEDVLALTKLRDQLGLPEYPVNQEPDDVSPELGRVGNEEDPYVSARRDYVEALGGRLEINAVFPDGTLTLLPGRRWAVPALDDAAEHLPRDEERPRSLAADVRVEERDRAVSAS